MCILPALAAAEVFLYDPFPPAGTGLNSFGAAICELRQQSDDPLSSFGLLVGDPNFGASANAGRVYLWFGGTELTLRANLVLTGQYNGNFGYAVARVGDLSGDGYDDFAVGEPSYSQSGLNDGRVYIYYGGPLLDDVADATLEGSLVFVGYTGGHFGLSVWAAGDFNGDGDDDLIVGAPYTNAPGLNQGAAFIYYGPISGNSRQPDLQLSGEFPGDLFGWSVTDAGNYFGGNEDAVAVGAPSHSAIIGIEAGAVYVFEGSLYPSDPDSIDDAKFVSNASTRAYGRFGFAVRGIGRWNTDSYDDIAVGAPNYLPPGPPTLTRGRIEVFFGGTSHPREPIADRYVDGEVNQDFFGFSLARVWDWTDNGRDDLLVGAPGQDADGFDSGRAYVYEGNTSSSVHDASSLIILPANSVNPQALANGFYGFAVAAANDFDGDGQADLAVGAPHGRIWNDSLAGTAHVLDSSGTVTGNFLLSWSSAWTEDGRVHLEFRFAEPVEILTWLTLSREVLRNGESLGSPVVVYDGPALPGTGSLEVRNGTWILEEQPETLPSGVRLVYDLVVILTDGREIRLDRLAGPTVQSIPLWLELSPPHPNPFNPQTTIGFRALAGQETVCRIMDMRGWHVATLFSGPATGAWQEVQWSGQADDGRTLPAGIYLIQLIAGDMSTARRLVLAK